METVAFLGLGVMGSGNPLVKTVGPRMLGGDYDVNFALSLMRKDLTYAIDDAAKHGVTLSTAASARALYDKAMESGLANVDFAAVVEPMRSASTTSPGRARRPASGA